MTKILIFSIIFQLFKVFTFIIAFSQWRRKYTKETKKYQETPADNFALYILLPAYNEQALVRDTVARITSITKQFAFVKPVFITTNREEYERTDPQIKTTTQLINEIEGTGNFIHLIFDSRMSSKSVQLNYAIDRLNLHDDSASYFLVLDFDAYITLANINNIISVFHRPHHKKRPPVLLQSVPVSIGYPGLNLPGSSFAMLDASSHFFRALSSEWFSYWLLEKKILNPVYSMGTGLVINAQWLKKIGGFPLSCDDLTIASDVLNLHGKAAFCFDTILVQPTFSNHDSVRQHIPIIAGLFLGLKKSIVKLFTFKRPILNLGYFFFWIIQLFNIVAIPLLIPVAIFSVHAFPYAIGLLIVFFMQNLVLYVSIRRVTINEDPFVLTFAAMNVHSIRRGINRMLGFYLYLIKLFLKVILKKNFKATKTSRYNEYKPTGN